MQPSSHPSGPRPMPNSPLIVAHNNKPSQNNPATSEVDPAKNKFSIRRVELDSTYQPPETEGPSRKYQRALNVSQFTQPRPAPIPAGWTPDQVPQAPDDSVDGVVLRQQTELIPKPARTVKGPGNSFFLHQGFLDILAYTKGSITKRANQELHGIHSLKSSHWTGLEVSSIMLIHSPNSLDLSSVYSSFLRFLSPPNFLTRLQPSGSIASASSGQLARHDNAKYALLNASTNTLARLGSTVGSTLGIGRPRPKESQRVSTDMIGKPHLLRYVSM